MDLSSAKIAIVQAQSCQIALVLEDALELGNTALVLKSGLMKISIQTHIHCL